MRRTVLAACALCLGLSTPSLAAGGAALRAPRDATQRLNALRKLAPGRAASSSIVGKRVASRYYRPVGFSMTIGDGLGHPPTLADVTVQKGLDGRTPSEALALVRGKLTNPVLPQNEALVNRTILDTHKAFTVAVNNAFTAGSPSNKLLTGDLAGAEVSILGVMSAVHPTVLMAKQPGQRLARFFAPAAGGSYEELKTLPYTVIMKARLEDGAKGGVRVSYQTWSKPALASPLTTVTELGSGAAPAPGN